MSELPSPNQAALYQASCRGHALLCDIDYLAVCQLRGADLWRGSKNLANLGYFYCIVTAGRETIGRQPGFFDVDDRLKRLSDLVDQLEAFRAVVDFEIFRPELKAALAYSDGVRGGLRPFDAWMMFKILVIQTTNTLSDERTKFLINDRLSFMRFPGLGLSDRVPDARTIWLFREKLTKAGAIGPLFERFDATLRQSG